MADNIHRLKVAALQKEVEAAQLDDLAKELHELEERARQVVTALSRLREPVKLQNAVYKAHIRLREARYDVETAAAARRGE